MKRILIRVMIPILLASNCTALAQELFDPDGYYFPENEIVIEGYKIDNFMLAAVSRYDPNDKSVDIDHPKRVTPVASLDLMRIKDKEIIPYRFHNPIIEKNGVRLVSVKTLIGNVTIKGKFLDTRGDFSNLDDVISFKTPIFEGTVTIHREGKLVYEKTSRFTYWEGD